MNMIEKVARALARDMLSDLGKAAFDNNSNYYKLSFSNSEHERLEAQARAAIEAMREPTEEMLFAGQIDLGSGGELDKENLTEVYQLMIDTALKE